MKLGGLQKLTLLDFPEKVACTVFTSGCNFRCPFCHNASLALAKDNDFSESEFFSFLKKRQGLLEGVCITGGEPLLQNDIEDFIREIKNLGFLVKLDTNGSFPEKLSKLLPLLDYVAMDIKNSPKKYLLTAGVDYNILDKVNQSIQILKNSDVGYEFRTTVTRELHSVKDFDEIGKWLEGVPRYYLQAFIDSGNIFSQNISAATVEDMQEYLKTVQQYIPAAKLRGI